MTRLEKKKSGDWNFLVKYHRGSLPEPVEFPSHCSQEITSMMSPSNHTVSAFNSKHVTRIASRAAEKTQSMAE